VGPIQRQGALVLLVLVLVLLVHLLPHFFSSLRRREREVVVVGSFGELRE
jgi:hypothetical protein